MPERFESTPLDLTADELLEAALARNTRLKAMEADVRAAEASIGLAHKARMPDTSLGLMADAKMNPTLYRPLGHRVSCRSGATSWRRRSPKRRPTSAPLRRGFRRSRSRWRWTWPRRSFLYREATRNLELLQKQLLPKQRQSLEVARSGYLAGQIDFFNLTDAEQTLLGLAWTRWKRATQRELVAGGAVADHPGHAAVRRRRGLGDRLAGHGADARAQADGTCRPGGWVRAVEECCPAARLRRRR